MFQYPQSFHEYLDRSNLISGLYDSMKKDDLAEVVMTALDILKKSDQLPKITKTEKSITQSNALREAGNTFLAKSNYKKALEHYNKALAFAPKSSRAMILAYSNRSYVMLQLKRFEACLTDIDYCFKLGCPEDIKEKLLARRENAKKLSFMDSFMIASLKACTHDYFNFTSKCHTALPSVSIKINVDIENSQPKITAASNIKIGTILAVEKAYIATVMAPNLLSTCHYCLKIDPCLIACDNCCTTLFCSENCKLNCNQEYHMYECQIIDIINAICNGSVPRLMIKTVLKLITMLGWKNFIKESKILGNRRLETSCAMNIFNSANDISMLSFSENKTFIHGVMYNASFVCATLLFYISQIPSFFPNSDDREAALRATARVMMYLSIYGPQTPVIQTVTDLVSDRTIYQIGYNAAWCPLYSKLKRTCTPNVIVSWIHNKAVLIALGKIKAGEEIFAAYINPVVSHKEQVKNVFFMTEFGTVCRCPNCSEGIKKDKLSSAQAKFMKNKDLVQLLKTTDIPNIAATFNKVCEILTVLNKATDTEEYADAIRVFLKCVTICAAIETENYNAQ